MSKEKQEKFHSYEEDAARRLNALMHDTCAMLGGLESYLFEKSPDLDEFHLISSTVPSSPCKVSLETMPPGSFLGRIISQKKVVQIPEILDPGRKLTINESIAPLINNRCLLGMPVPDNNRIIGFILVGAKEPITLEGPLRDSLVLVLKTLGSALAFHRGTNRIRETVARKELQLQELKEKYTSLFSKIAEGIIVIDSEGRILETNNTYLKWSGYTRDELVGSRLGAHTLKEIEESGKAQFPAKQSECLSLSCRQQCIHGSERELSLLVLTNKSSQVQAEASDKQPGLNGFQLDGELLHSLNNLVGGLRGHSYLAISQLNEGHPSHSSLKQIEQASMEAVEMIKKIKRDNQQSSTDPEFSDINETVREVMEFLKRTVDPGVSLIGHLTPDLPKVQITPSELFLGMLNLCLYTKETIPEGGKITLRTAIVENKNDHSKVVQITLADNGVHNGTAESESLCQSDCLENTETPIRDAELIGLRQSVENAGGSISSLSSNGERRQYEINLPVSAPDPVSENKQVSKSVSAPVEQEIPALPCVPEESEKSFFLSKNLHGKQTVLVVDDEHLMKSLAAQVLMEAGYDVLTASNGKEAIKSLRQNPKDVDLILLDWVMPGMSGRDTFQELRKIRPNVHVVLTSGYHSEDIPVEFLNADSTGFLHKPYQVFDLIQQVENILKS